MAQIPLQELVSLQDDLGSDIFSLYLKLTDLKSLKPCPQVNSLLNQFVQIILANPVSDEQVMNNDLLSDLAPKLRHLCSKAESLLEEHWAQKWLKSDNIDVTTFPYYACYKGLSEMEYGLIKKHHHKKILFIGSGPLPLTAILLAQHHHLNVDCLDIDQKAVKLSSKVIAKLHLSNNIKVIHQNLLNFNNLQEYDIIILASLVGGNEHEKKEILYYLSKHIREDAVILLRTVEGLKTLLYQPIVHHDLDGFDILESCQPPKNVINSLLVVKKNG